MGQGQRGMGDLEGKCRSDHTAPRSTLHGRSRGHASLGLCLSLPGALCLFVPVVMSSSWGIWLLGVGSLGTKVPAKIPTKVRHEEMLTVTVDDLNVCA